MSCTETPDVPDNLQQQLWSLPCSPGPDREFPQHQEFDKLVFHKAFLKYLSPSQVLHKPRLKSFSTLCHQKVTEQNRHWLPLPGESVQPALLPCPVWAFLKPRWDELSWQSSLLPATILPEVLQLTNKQEHAGFLCSREEKHGASYGHPGRGEPTPCSRAARSRDMERGLPRQNPSQAALLDYRQQHLPKTLQGRVDSSYPLMRFSSIGSQSIP